MKRDSAATGTMQADELSRFNYQNTADRARQDSRKQTITTITRQDRARTSPRRRYS